MAKLTLNPYLGHLRGQIGDLVFKRYGEQIVVTRKPDMSRVQWSEAQQEGRERFRQAIAHGKRVLADPVRKAEYAARAKAEGKPIFSLVLADYYQAAVQGRGAAGPYENSVPSASRCAPTDGLAMARDAHPGNAADTANETPGPRMPRNDAKDAKAFRTLRGLSQHLWSKHPAPILLILCLLCLATLVSACTGAVTDTQNAPVDRCIPPLTTFAFPVNQVSHASSNHNIMPLSTWRMISELPAQKTDGSRVTSQIMLTRSADAEIWIIRDLDKEQGDRISSLLIYDVNANSWNELPDAFGAISPYVRTVYDGQDALWTVSTWPNNIIGAFDEQSRKFRPLNLADQIPDGQIYFDQRRDEF